MKNKEMQPKINMTPVWEKKDSLIAMLLSPILFLIFCVVITTLLALFVGFCSWLSHSLKFFCFNFL